MARPGVSGPPQLGPLTGPRPRSASVAAGSASPEAYGPADVLGASPQTRPLLPGSGPAAWMAHTGQRARRGRRPAAGGWLRAFVASPAMVRHAGLGHPRLIEHPVQVRDFPDRAAGLVLVKMSRCAARDRPTKKAAVPYRSYSATCNTGGYRYPPRTPRQPGGSSTGRAARRGWATSRHPGRRGRAGLLHPPCSIAGPWPGFERGPGRFEFGRGRAAAQARRTAQPVHGRSQAGGRDHAAAGQQSGLGRVLLGHYDRAEPVLGRGSHSGKCATHRPQPTVKAQFAEEHHPVRHRPRHPAHGSEQAYGDGQAWQPPHPHRS
jgi:hypothetical protein